MNKIILVLFLIIGSIMLISYHPKEEPIEFMTYFNELNEQYGGDNAQILDYINKELENKKNSPLEHGVNLLARQHYLYVSGKGNLLFEYEEETERYLIQHKQAKELLHYYSMLASIASGMENYNDAYVYIYRGEQLAQKIYTRERNEENLSTLIAIKYLKAIVALDIGMKQEADTVFLEAEKLRKQAKNMRDRVDIYSNILLYYQAKNNVDLIEQYGEKLLTIIYKQDPELYTYKSSWYQAKRVLAQNYLAQDNMAECLEIIKILNENEWVFKSTKRSSEMYHLYAEVLQYYNKDEEALMYLMKSYEVIKDRKESIQKIKIVEHIIESLKQVEDEEQLKVWYAIERDLMKEILDVKESQYLLKKIINTDLQKANYSIEVLQLQRKGLNYFVCLLFGILVLSFMIVVLELRRKRLLKANMMILEHNLHFKHQYYEDIKLHLDNLKQTKHDLKNHLAIIYQLIAKKDYKDAQSYIQKIEEKVVSPLDEIITQNKIINAIIMHKINICRDKNIKLELDIQLPKELPFDDFDLCVILGNLLDNAIEACEKLPHSDPRYIKLKSAIQEDHFYLNIKNSFSSNVIKSGSKFLTLKSDKLNHGLGIKNIKISVKKYQGFMNITHENSEFNVAILLTMNEK